MPLVAAVATAAVEASPGISAADQQLEALFRRVQLDDYGAFRELFGRLYPPLCHVALRLVPRPEVAEEVVADVFFKLWKRRAAIQITTSFRAYLYRAVRNQALDYLKSTAATADACSIELTPRTAAWPTADPGPQHQLEYQELAQRVAVAVGALPPQCQAIFRLNREDGLRYQEIADLLQLSIKTVETQMGRALKSLRAALPRLTAQG